MELLGNLIIPQDSSPDLLADDQMAATTEDSTIPPLSSVLGTSGEAEMEVAIMENNDVSHLRCPPCAMPKIKCS